MTAEDIYNRYKLGIPGAFETVGEADEAILAAIKEAFNVNATRLTELENDNKELREGHYKDTTDAYEAGHEDGFYEAMNVSIHVYSGSHDYYTKTFNNEK